MQLKPIFLWGYMGAGKTRLGKRLASAMSLEFIDLDAAIEQEFNLTVSNIFSQLGEIEFRQKERELIIRFSQQNNVIISCGGGAPCYFDNKHMMLNSGNVIFLKVEIDELQNRLWKNRKSRPIIASQPSKESLLEFIKSHLAERLPYYSQAHYVYNNTNPKTNLSDLVNWIKENQ